MNRARSTKDLTLHQPLSGVGVAMRWKCGGCHQIRSMAGSRGVGVRKRCGECVSKRQASCAQG
jgi:hypothetical protein